MCLKNLGCLGDSENFPARHDLWGDPASGANRERRAGVSRVGAAGLPASAPPGCFSSRGIPAPADG